MSLKAVHPQAENVFDNGLFVVSETPSLSCSSVSHLLSVFRVQKDRARTSSQAYGVAEVVLRLARWGYSGQLIFAHLQLMSLKSIGC